MRLDSLLFDEGSPDEVLVHAGGRTATRAEIVERAERCCEALGELGVAPGDVVAVQLDNGIDVVVALFAVWHAGAVYLPLNPRLTEPEHERLLAAVPPAALLGPNLQLKPAPERGSSLQVGGFDDDVALIQFTSGTTGPPKPVVLRHSGVLALLDGVLRKLRSGSAGAAPARRPMPNLIPVSLSLWAGIYNVLFALRVGAPVVVMDHFEPVEFARLVRAHDIRSTVLPPAAMTMLVDSTVTDLAPLRFVRSITAPLSPLQARRFIEKFGVSVLNSYGQTEIGGEIVGWNAADSRAFGDTKLGSVGRPHEGVRLRVVDDDGRDVDDGLPGELLVQTPALAAGYADGTDLGDRLTDDGWFRTGDHARIDADGFVWIEGRVSDMINRGGLKVYPGEVEEVLRLDPDVADVAVVGMPDPRLGEVPWAFVVPAEGAEIDRPALVELARTHLAPFKVPKRFEVIDALPRNEVGKVMGRVLVERATR